MSLLPHATYYSQCNLKPGLKLSDHGLLCSLQKLLWRHSVSQKGLRMGLDRLCCRCHKSGFHCGIDFQLWSAFTSVDGLLQRKQGKDRWMINFEHYPCLTTCTFITQTFCMRVSLCLQAAGQLVYSSSPVASKRYIDDASYFGTKLRSVYCIRRVIWFLWWSLGYR